MLRRFLGSAAVYTIANVINAAIPFALLPILTRLLSPADYGTVAMFSTTVLLLGAVTGLNVHGAVSVRYFQQDEYHLPSYVRCAVMLILSATTLVALLAALTGHWLVPFLHLPAEWLVLAAVLSGAQFVMQIQLAIWQAEHKPIRYGALRIGQSLLDATLSLVAIFLLSRTWEARAGSQWVAGIAFAILTLGLLHRSGWLAGRLDRQYVKNLLRFGIPLIPHTLGGLMIALIDRYMVSNMLGVASTGVYMAALQLGMAMGLVSDAFVKAFGPWLNRQLKLDDAASRQRVVGAVYVSFMVFPVVGAIFYGVVLAALGLVLPSTYHGASAVMPFFILGNTFLGMYYAIAGLIFYSSQTYRIAKITGVIGVISIPMTYALISWLGMVGAGISYSLSQLFVFLLAWHESRALFDLPWRDVRTSIQQLARSR